MINNVNITVYKNSKTIPDFHKLIVSWFQKLKTYVTRLVSYVNVMIHETLNFKTWIVERLELHKTFHKYCGPLYIVIYHLCASLLRKCDGKAVKSECKAHSRRRCKKISLDEEDRCYMYIHVQISCMRKVCLKSLVGSLQKYQYISQIRRKRWNTVQTVWVYPFRRLSRFTFPANRLFLQRFGNATLTFVSQRGCSIPTVPPYYVHPPVHPPSRVIRLTHAGTLCTYISLTSY